MVPVLGEFTRMPLQSNFHLQILSRIILLIRVGPNGCLLTFH